MLTDINKLSAERRATLVPAARKHRPNAKQRRAMAAIVKAYRQRKHTGRTQ